MKPAPFRYERPRDLDEALGLLSEHGDDAKVLAGGQSLVPMLNFRLARPEVLVDISGLSEMSFVRKSGGRLSVGATTKQTRAHQSSAVAGGWPMLREALGWVAHSQIRNLGTIGGSIAHADPAAELPVASVALGASLRVASARGERVVEARDFFVTHLTTVLEPDELLVAVDFPALPVGAGWGFVEYARRHGDFALGGAASILTVDADGRCTTAVLTLMTAAPTPLRVAEAEAALLGSQLEDRDLDAAAAAAAAGTTPTGDIHGSSEYRKGLIEVMARRALDDARGRVGSG